jgi:DNA-binding CsgD family transcriptional regulator
LADAASLTAVLGDAEAAGRMLAEADALAERLGDPAARAAVTYVRGHLALINQPPDPGRGMAVAEQALAEAQAVGDLRRVSLNLLLAASAGGFHGDPRAAGYAEQCRALGEAHVARWTQAWGQLLLAGVRYEQGDEHQVAELLHQALPVQLLVHDFAGASVGLEILAWTAAAAGDHERAARLLGAGQALKRRGASFADVGPYREHRAQCVRDARDALGEAAYAAAFEAGSRCTLEEAVGHALGGHRARHMPSRPPTRSAGDLLTRREGQIAALVAQGLTNRDIATQLVISRRTAESHVDHILTKLGFTSRAQIAKWVAERR